MPDVLAQTPGVVLIDELDVHLHPRWQRRVATDLKSAFPRIQFVCTTHSPQVIGEVAPEEIRILDDAALGRAPAHSYGLDSNAILVDVMGADTRTPTGARTIEAVEAALEEGDLAKAREELDRLRQLQHGETRDTARLEATINNLEVLTDAEHDPRDEPVAFTQSASESQNDINYGYDLIPVNCVAEIKVAHR